MQDTTSPFTLKEGGAGLAVTIGASLAFIFTLKSFESLIIFITLAFSIFYVLTRMVIYPSRYRQVKKLRLWRKVLRFFALVLPFIYIFEGKAWILVIAVLILLLFILNDILRNFAPHSATKIFTKEKEKSISGMTYFMIGTLITAIFFEKDIAILSLIFFTLGDNFAAIFGSKYGKDRILKGKTIEGSFFFFATAFFGAYIFLHLDFVNIEFSKMVFGAFAASIIELFSNNIDDNLTVPVLSGLIMTII